MSFSSQSSIIINAPVSKVWEAVTLPEQVKEYFFGTNLVTTWEVGSPIFFRGEWEGKAYEDKGTVLAYEPMQRLSYDYFSPLSGNEDKPEAYYVLEYILEEVEGGTKFSINQSNVATQESADHSAKNWQMVLDGMKKYIEAKA